MYRYFLLVIIFIGITAISCNGQLRDTSNDYYLHYKCDTANGRVQNNLDLNCCSLKYFLIADSILEKTYMAVLNSHKSEILRDSIEIIQQKDSVDLVEFLKKEITWNKKMKLAIIISEEQWLETREANAQVIELGCEGGMICNKMVNDFMTDETYDRINVLRDWDMNVDDDK